MQKKTCSAPMKVSPKAPQRLPKGPKGPPKPFFVIVGPKTKKLSL